MGRGEPGQWKIINIYRKNVEKSHWWDRRWLGSEEGQLGIMIDCDVWGPHDLPRLLLSCQLSSRNTMMVITTHSTWPGLHTENYQETWQPRPSGRLTGRGRGIWYWQQSSINKSLQELHVLLSSLKLKPCKRCTVIFISVKLCGTCRDFLLVNKTKDLHREVGEKSWWCISLFCLVFRSCWFRVLLTLVMYKNTPALHTLCWVTFLSGGGAGAC